MGLNFNVSRLVLIANTVSTYTRKQLNQQDRRILTLACETLKKPDYIEFFFGKEKKLKKLIKTLSLNESQVVLQAPYCSILKAIFKAVANFLNFRISNQEVESKLKEAFVNFIPKNEYFVTYQEILSIIAQKKSEFKISTKKFLYIGKTIQSLYFLSTQKYSLINGEVNLQEDLKTGFSLVKEENTAQMVNAPELLVQKYQEAKEKNNLRDFFEDAFNPIDRNDFAMIHRRISKFNMPLNELKQDLNPLIEEIRPPIIVEVPRHIKTLELPPIPHIDKKKTRFLNTSHLSDVFKDRQARKYAHDLGWQIKDDWVKMSTQIYQQQDFKDNYYNLSAFEKFLKEEVEIVGEETSEGLFLEGQIQFYSQKIFNLEEVVPYQAWRER